MVIRAGYYISAEEARLSAIDFLETVANEHSDSKDCFVWIERILTTSSTVSIGAESLIGDLHDILIMRAGYYFVAEKARMPATASLTRSQTSTQSSRTTCSDTMRCSRHRESNSTAPGSSKRD